MFLLKLLEVEAPTDVPERPSALGMLSPEGYAHAALYAAATELPEHKGLWLAQKTLDSFMELPQPAHTEV